MCTPASGIANISPARSHAMAERKNQLLPNGGMNSASPQDAGVNQVWRKSWVICARE